MSSLHRSGRYGHAMLIDGNDLRGIDVGLLCNADIELVSVRSNVDVPDPAAPTPRPLFSRDSPVYQLRLPGGDDLWVLVNHLKSQSFSSGDPDPLRSRQSAEVRRIYDRLRDQGAELVAVIGDFNKGPTNDQPPQHPTLEPLLGPDSPLVDATTLPGFDPGAAAGHIPVVQPAQPARLHPAVGGAGRHRHRRRHLPQGPVGRPWQRQPASGLGDLPGDHRLGPRRLRPRRHLGRPRPVATRLDGRLR
jgi:hypothetical protein